MHSDNIDNKNAFRDNNDNARREFSIFFFRLVHALDIFPRKISKSFNHCCWFFETFSNRWIFPDFFPKFQRHFLTYFLKQIKHTFYRLWHLHEKVEKTRQMKWLEKICLCFSVWKRKFGEKSAGKFKSLKMTSIIYTNRFWNITGDIFL